MNSWVSHIEREEIINEGKFLDARNKAWKDFCKLVVDECRETREFLEEHMG